MRAHPLAVAIPEAEQDRDLPDRLVEESGAGVLRWIVDGARVYLRRASRARLRDGRDQGLPHREDWFGTWLAERTIALPRCRRPGG